MTSSTWCLRNSAPAWSHLRWTRTSSALAPTQPSDVHAHLTPRSHLRSPRSRARRGMTRRMSLHLDGSGRAIRGTATRRTAPPGTRQGSLRARGRKDTGGCVQDEGGPGRHRVRRRGEQPESSRRPCPAPRRLAARHDLARRIARGSARAPSRPGPLTRSPSPAF
jgi:hypothetical protein